MAIVGQRFLPGHPRKNEWIGNVEQRLKACKLRLVHAVKLRVCEAAEDQIHLAHPPMPGAKLQPPPARSKVEICGSNGAHVRFPQ